MEPKILGRHAASIYQYEAIDSSSIRLVRLKPGLIGDAIVCELLSTSVENAQSYEAISYVWGDNKDLRELRLNNQKFVVTKNLYNTLQSIRSPLECRVLWVDAICINQADLGERAQQVQMMGAIYTNAAHVLICLGHDTGRSSHEVLRMVCEKDTLDTLSEVQTASIASLLRSAWFARVWTIQEAALAQHPCLLWGDVKIEWHLLMQLLQKIGNQSIAVGDLWHQVGFEWNLWLAHLAYNANDTRLVHLVRLMHAARGHSASDARDHVFAFLGHPANMSHGKCLLTAEYVVPKIEVFRKVSLKLLSSMQNLDVLSYVTHDESYGLSSQEPSWIPNWDKLSCTTDGFQVRMFPFEASKMFDERCVVSSHTFFATTDNDKTLILEGMIIDHVEWHSETMIYKMISPGLWTSRTRRHPIEQAWFDLQSHLMDRGIDHEDLLKLFSLMLVSGQTKKEEVERRGSDHSANFDAWRLEHSKHVSPVLPTEANPLFYHEARPSDEAAGEAGEWSKFVSDAFQSCNGRRMFCTAKGDMGSGPMAMRPGDVVVSLHGARTPFILRSVGAGDNRFILIGEAYLHGLLFHDDTFWRNPAKEQEFHII